jgi:serine protease Do
MDGMDEMDGMDGWARFRARLRVGLARCRARLRAKACRVLAAGLLAWPLAAFAGDAPVAATDEPDIPDWFAERCRSFVYMEYVVQREMDRQPVDAAALVLDAEGLLVTGAQTFAEWIPPDQFSEIRVHLPRNVLPDGVRATYLGPDPVTGWHYLRVGEEAWPHLTPISAFGMARPRIGDELWGICIAGKDFDHIPYYRHGRLEASQLLPQLIGFASTEVASPGGPVFAADGRFAGWATFPFPSERDMWIGAEYYRVSLRNNEESSSFFHAAEFLARAGRRLPATPLGDPRPWLGISGAQPLDKDTAEFLGLAGQGALMISEVLPDTPAAVAGLRDRDILVAIDGARLPRLKPDWVVQSWFEMNLLERAVGSPIRLTVVRGEAEVEVEAVLTAGPTVVRAAARQYWPDLGLTAREFLVSDALARRVDHRQPRGMVVSFVRPNSPPDEAGLQAGDWITEVDGADLVDFAAGRAALAAIDADPGRREYVLLVRRGNETAVLRVKRSDNQVRQDAGP